MSTPVWTPVICDVALLFSSTSKSSPNASYAPGPMVPVGLLSPRLQMDSTFSPGVQCIAKVTVGNAPPFGCTTAIKRRYAGRPGMDQVVLWRKVAIDHPDRSKALRIMSSMCSRTFCITWSVPCPLSFDVTSCCHDVCRDPMELQPPLLPPLFPPHRLMLRKHLPLQPPRQERPQALASLTECPPSPATWWISSPATERSHSSRTSTRQVACGTCGTSASHAWYPVVLPARISGMVSKLSSPLPSDAPHNPSPYISSGPLPDSFPPFLCPARDAAGLGTSRSMRVAFRRGVGVPLESDTETQQPRAGP